MSSQLERDLDAFIFGDSVTLNLSQGCEEVPTPDYPIILKDSVTGEPYYRNIHGQKVYVDGEDLDA